ncbi:MAG: hypothetical protein IK095_03005 [Oscillospiraceae bacterium]|nr:hypothetical protein [Oscillospiraceae bacterium]
MSSIYSFFERPEALLLMMTALFLTIGQTAAFLLSAQEKRNRGQTLVAALHMLVGFLMFVIVLDGFDNVNFSTIRRDTVQTGWTVFSLPWSVYAAYEVISAVALLLQFREYRRYRATTVTPDAIRQTIDLLPEGICVSAPDGTVRLANLKMDALCRELTGERLSDARKFWAHLEQTGEDQSGKRLIRTPRGKVWLFAKDSLSIDGSEHECTSAVDVSERYRITEELREKNARLQQIQRRMKAAAALSGEMFIEQERANARSALHNELGQVLLMGRHYIEHPDSTDAAMVALMTRQMGRFLLGEHKATGPDAGDELRQAVQMAGSIGVTVDLKGVPPEEARSRSLLAAAIRECAANTVKHAEGDRLFIAIKNSDEGAIVTITNNGEPPKGPVAESGGLLSLRRSVEAAGGKMLVKSLPAFSLTLSFQEA